MAQHSLSLNGRQVVQESQFLRAAMSHFFARGNRSVTLSFTVQRAVDTVANAELFFLGHYASLSNGPATLLCVCGATNVLIADAVLESASLPRYTGISVDVSYVFRAPRIVTAYSIVTTDLDDVSITGTQSIPSGVSAHTFTGLGFAGVPVRIIGSVVVPSGEGLIFGSPVIGSQSTDGFDIVLSGVTPSANYQFAYIAVI